MSISYGSCEAVEGAGGNAFNLKPSSRRLRRASASSLLPVTAARPVAMIREVKPMKFLVMR